MKPEEAERVYNHPSQEVTTERSVLLLAGRLGEDWDFREFRISRITNY